MIIKVYPKDGKNNQKLRKNYFFLGNKLSPEGIEPSTRGYDSLVLPLNYGDGQKASEGN